MSDSWQDPTDHFRQQPDERRNPRGGRGRRAERNIADEFTAQTGHTPGGSSGDSPRDRPMPVDNQSGEGV